ncbi:hypothetical protein ACSBPH_16435 [Microbacterium sp. F51-2R]
MAKIADVVGARTRADDLSAYRLLVVPNHHLLPDDTAKALDRSGLLVGVE